jgi:hypothetical protein
MKYLLLLSLIGFFSWPYYHRMRTFGWEPVKSYAIALLPSFFIALGIVKVIVDVGSGTYIDFPHLPDILTKWTFVIIFIIFVGLFCWLMFTAEWCKDTSGPVDDGAFFLAICMLAICCAQAFFVTDVIIKVVMVI